MTPDEARALAYAASDFFDGAAAGRRRAAQRAVIADLRAEAQRLRADTERP